MSAFYLKKPGVLAFGIAHRDGRFVLAAGSNVRNKQSGNMSVYRKGPFKIRKRLFKDGVISGDLVFTRNYEFKNISECTSVILGQSRSGDSWFNADGVSYPDWQWPDKPSAPPRFKRGGRFTTFNKERLLVEERDVIESLRRFIQLNSNQVH